MASQVTNVDPPTLREAAADVRSAHTDLSAQVKGITNKVEQLRVEWQGPAATKFQELMGAWGTEVGRLLTEMIEISEKLDGAAGARDQTESDESRDINAVAQGDNKYGTALKR